ncbi:T9SS C-terminal target domain-containing protein [Bacteroidetes/Chlorobi group bacterium ChocPot_Mid]|nr:MAG: T9SS C-terminal target domain-containing protein [Bacteroidetes/Chlorobi group bacterium ChocPot_Mid]
MKIYFRIIVLSIILITNTYGKTWRVQPDGEYKYCSDISNLVSDSDTILIEQGLYENDRQVSWTKNNLVIIGVNKPILRAGDIIANDNSNGKGIFVIKGNNTLIENIEFQNCKVQSRNGAGIRQEGSNLIVRYCIFNGNEMGILQGGTIPDCKIVVEHCVFMNNGSTENPGYQHNIYINHIDTLIFRYNFTYDAIAEGHELKSRANNNYILYNRISNFSSTDSRNIDLPNGGRAIIMGNIIEQGENSSNSNIIGFGLEGLVNPPPHNLWICSNTIVNRKNKGSFVNIANIDTLFMKNNICVGAKTGGFIIGNASMLDTSHNFISDNINSPLFFDVNDEDYHLNSGSPAIDAGVELNEYAMGLKTQPEYEYQDTSKFVLRNLNGTIDLGAYEFKTQTDIDNKIGFGNDEFVIFPNPATKSTNIFYKTESSEIIIQIINNLGSVVYSCVMQTHESDNKINIDTERLPVGVYYLFVKDKKKIHSEMLIVLD